MYGVELYAAVRLAVVDEGLSHHEAGRRFGIDRRTVKKMLSYSAPPGYRRTKPVRRPKLGGFTGIVDTILEADTDPDVPRKQRHTAHRIFFERLRDEHGFTGGYTIVKDYVRSRRQSTREAFVAKYVKALACPKTRSAWSFISRVTGTEMGRFHTTSCTYRPTGGFRNWGRSRHRADKAHRTSQRFPIRFNHSRNVAGGPPLGPAYRQASPNCQQHQ